MTIKEIRKLTGLTQLEFSEKYGIPKRSIQNWENEVRVPPEYITNLLERAVRADTADTRAAFQQLKEHEDATQYALQKFAETIERPCDEECGVIAERVATGKEINGIVFARYYAEEYAEEKNVFDELSRMLGYLGLLGEYEAWKVSGTN